MEQTDPFYQQLPFTLQEEQLDPEYVIFGTGLQESALAAYLSKMTQKKCLIFDQEKTYGSCLKTITLKQLHLLAQRTVIQKLFTFFVPQKYKLSNDTFFTDSMSTKAFRGYNIDIEPSLFFGDSITCECLKQADMDKYMDFRLVNHMLKYEKGVFSQVPLSKGKIFQSKQLSLLEKKLLLTSLHTLIKLFHRHMNIQQDQNSTKQFDKGFGQVSQQMYNDFKDNLNNYFLPFLQKITKKNKKIIDFMSYIICNYQYNVNKNIPEHAKESYTLKNFIEKFGKFISSCGIYGETPYLYVDNGIGDIPQAFSRIASIFGSTYILHPKLQIDSIEETQEGLTIKSNIAPGKQIKTKRIFYGETYTQLFAQKSVSKVQLHTQNIFRVIILCKKQGNEQQCPSLGYFLDTEGFQNPVYLFMFDSSSHTCPSGYILYQFQTVIQLSAQQSQVQKGISTKTQIFVDKLTEIRGKQFVGSIVYLTSYIRKANSFNKPIQERLFPQNLPKQVCLQGSYGLDLDVNFLNFIKIIGKQENYFRKKNPYQDQEEDDQCQRDIILNQLQSINIHKEEESNIQVGEIQNKLQIPIVQKKQQSQSKENSQKTQKIDQKI